PCRWRNDAPDAIARRGCLGVARGSLWERRHDSSRRSKQVHPHFQRGRADCNFGNGTYTVNNLSIELKVGALTRAMCPPESLSDQFLRNLGDVRSFLFRNGELNLELMADAGIFRFAATVPAEATPTAGEGTPAGG